MSLEQMRAVSEMLQSRPDNVDLAERRARFERYAETLPIPPDTRFEPARIRDDLAGLWVIDPASSPTHAILWLHGGAFFLGSSTSYRPIAAALARAARARVFVPDYRLVPEHPFPAATIDAQHAIEWLDTQGFPPERLGIGGDSAGANLAAGAIQARIDAGRAPPAAAWLLSGYLDLTHSGGSIATRAARDSFINPAHMPATQHFYLRDADPKDPRASPLFGNAAGFPPTLVQVGSDEVLFDDSYRFAEKLRSAGREVVFQEWAGMIHVWPYFVGQVDEAAHATAQAGVFFQRHLLGA